MTATDESIPGDGPRLIGVGVGPGDPELLTLRAVRLLQQADHVLVPVTDQGDIGRAESIIAPHVDAAKLVRIPFTMSGATDRGANWDRAGRQIVALIEDGGTAAFATLGDPNVYSTFTYVAHTVRALLPTVTVETTPGIMAMQDLAARTNTVLTEGDERLALVPFTADEPRLTEAFAGFDTVVLYKGGRRMGAVLDAATEAGRLEDAVYGARLGLDDEEIRPAAELVDRLGPYLSTVIVPPRRGERGARLEQPTP